MLNVTILFLLTIISQKLILVIYIDTDCIVRQYKLFINFDFIQNFIRNKI